MCEEFLIKQIGINACENDLEELVLFVRSLSDKYMPEHVASRIEKNSIAHYWLDGDVPFVTYQDI